MTLLIGTDEAGYGPNLGPLVVAASAWRVVEGGDDGADRLARAGAEIGAAARLGQPPWADSKQLYKPGGGLIAIERGVTFNVSACTATRSAKSILAAARRKARVLSAKASRGPGIKRRGVGPDVLSILTVRPVSICLSRWMTPRKGM